MTDRDLVRAMQLAEKMGDAKILASELASWTRLATSKDAASRSEYSRLEGVLSIWQAIETTYGVGSLLRLDHPSVVRFIEAGAIDFVSIGNAIRYRALGEPGLG